MTPGLLHSRPWPWLSYLSNRVDIAPGNIMKIAMNWNIDAPILACFGLCAREIANSMSLMYPDYPPFHRLSHFCRQLWQAWSGLWQQFPGCFSVRPPTGAPWGRGPSKLRLFSSRKLLCTMATMTKPSIIRFCAPSSVPLAGRSGLHMAWWTASPLMRGDQSPSTGPCQGLNLNSFTVL